ncbi:ArnT family glycosyltransferase [Paenibacillus sp. MBLB4367]|uniref:ArnT family glycosyltransferase n=1 Tax=Paenibacillus sp. MBLB4367 TaxID=3384767 RepID=UPI0039082B9E
MEETGKGNAIIGKLLIGAGLVFFALTLVPAYRNTATYIGNDWLPALIAAVTLILLIALSHVLTKYVPDWLYIGLLVVLAAGVRIVWVMTIDTQPVSDFLDMHTAAVQAANGDISFGGNEYFSRWVYQLGFTMYQALIVNLFGDSLLVLKAFNIAFSVGTAIVVYAAAAQAFNRFSGRAASLLYALYVPNIIMCSVLTNQHISTFFFFLGLYLIVRKGLANKTGWLFIGLCFGVANLMRPLGSFFLIGLLAYVVLFKLFPWHKGRSLGAASRTLGVIAVYMLVQQIASYSLIQAGVTTLPLSSQEPYWKFMVGLNQETTGGWSYDDDQYVIKYALGEERNAAELALLKERMADKGQVVSLFADKFAFLWGREDSAPTWSMWEIERPYLKEQLIKGERVLMFFLLASGLIAMAALLFAKTGETKAQLFLLLLLGYASLHIVIEIQTRYRFDIMPCVFILQSYGVYAVFMRMKAVLPGRQSGAG